MDEAGLTAARRASGNTNDLRGKILRIRPEADGTYSIPAGNLFPSDGSAGRPEIYVMGNRNPYRISIDPETGWLYWGDVGPDAEFDDLVTTPRGPRGYDEINQAREAGNYGWPYIIADNKAYYDFTFPSGPNGPAFDPNALVNDSPNNTGETNLPPAQPALIWYHYNNGTVFPELNADIRGRTAMAGPVYQFDPALDSEVKLPEYFDGTLIMYDWSRHKFWEVKLDQNGDLLKINQIFVGLTFSRPIEAEMGPDGALYVIEWGSNFGGGNANAKLVRVEFVGNLPRLLGDYNKNNFVDAADYTVWRNAAGQTDIAPYSGADGNGDGKITRLDYDVWKQHYGETFPPMGTGSGAVVSSGAGSEAVLVAALVSENAPVVAFAEDAPLQHAEEQRLVAAEDIPSRTLSTYLSSTQARRSAALHMRPQSLTPALSQREWESSIRPAREWMERDAALLRWLDRHQIDERVNGDLDCELVLEAEPADVKSETETKTFDDALAMLTAAI